MKKALALLVLSLFALQPLASQNNNSPKREFRGAWIHTVGNGQFRTMDEKGVKELFIRILDSLQMTGCNAVIFQVRPQADALYESELEPWSRFLTGTQGLSPGWDPLEFMIEESHKRGMELHAWCNPYRVTSNNSERLSPNHFYFRHPEIFKRYGKQLYFDPGEPLSIEFTKRVIADIVKRYDIDAIHFDDYFYPYPVKYEEFHDDASFVKYAKTQGFEYWEKNDWRRNNVRTLIKELNDTIKSIKPWVRFGISPFGIHRNIKETPDSSGSRTNGLSNYEQLFADIPLWAVEGSVDYIVPQLYWAIGHPTADFKTLIEWWNRGNFSEHLYIGQNIAVLSSQLKDKMELVRRLPNVKGNVWWPGWSITKNVYKIADSLIIKYQSRPALIPSYSRLDTIPPLPIIGATTSAKGIKWEVEPTDDPLQQPRFYAVYIFPPKKEADINNSDYLVSITNKQEYKFDKKSKPKKGSSCVITVIDRCWNESKSFLLPL